LFRDICHVADVSVAIVAVPGILVSSRASPPRQGSQTAALPASRIRQRIPSSPASGRAPLPARRFITAHWLCVPLRGRARSAELALDALEIAIRARQGDTEGLVHHSDRCVRESQLPEPPRNSGRFTSRSAAASVDPWEMLLGRRYRRPLRAAASRGGCPSTVDDKERRVLTPSTFNL
jgi:hypothetical protein